MIFITETRACVKFRVAISIPQLFAELYSPFPHKGKKKRSQNKYAIVDQ